MNDWPWTYWLMIVLGLTGSALYSGLETGSYSLNRVRLQIFKQKGRHAAQVLGRLIESPATLLGVLLIGNNVTNYVGTAGVTLLLEDAGLSDWQVVVANVLIVTPLLLVFGEILPKDLFAAHSDALMYKFSGFLRWSTHLFRWTGLLFVVRVFGGGAGAGGGRTGLQPRRQVMRMVREGAGSGLLSEEQLAIAQRVLELNERTVGGEMVAWDRVVTVGVDSTAQEVWELANRTSHARVPVIDARGQVVGVLSVTDVLLHDREHCPPIAELMNPDVTRLERDTPLRSGLAALQVGRPRVAIVTDGGRPVGIVTIKDLIEAITGELMSW